MLFSGPTARELSFSRFTLICFVSLYLINAGSIFLNLLMSYSKGFSFFLPGLSRVQEMFKSRDTVSSTVDINKAKEVAFGDQGALLKNAASSPLDPRKTFDEGPSGLFFFLYCKCSFLTYFYTNHSFRIAQKQPAARKSQRPPGIMPIQNFCLRQLFITSYRCLQESQYTVII